MKKLNSVLFVVLSIIFLLPYAMNILWGFSSFTDGKLEMFNLQGYRELFEVSSRWKTIAEITGRSFIISILSTIIAFMFAYYLIRNYKDKIRIIILGLMTIPFLVSEATRVFIWNYILGSEGVVPTIIKWLGMASENNYSLLNNEGAVWLVMITNTVPISIFVLFIVLSSINQNMWKVSNDLGSTQLVDLFKLAIPNAKYGIWMSIIMVFLVTYTLSTEVQFLGGATKASIKIVIADLLGAYKISGVMFMGTIFILIVGVLNAGALVIWKMYGGVNEK